MAARTSMDFVPDRVGPATPGDPVDLWVYSVFPKTGWVPHSPGDRTRPEHPGSAIKYGSEIYELMRIEETTDGEYQFRYGLRAWDLQYAIRHLVNYTLKTQQEGAEAHEEVARTRRLRSLILWLMPFAGFAPDPLQREWAKRTGLSMGWISAGSAMFGFLAAFALRGASEDVRWAAGVLYLALESFARLLWTAISHAPHGSPLLTLAYLLWEAGTPRRRAKEKASPALRMNQDELSWGANGNSLEVRSPYFDTTLAGPALVSFEGAVYRPVCWHQEGKGLARRWIYGLEKIEPESSAFCREYRNPRTAERQKAAEDFTHRLDLAQSFSLFWGVYPRREQLRLQLLYQHDGPHATAATAGLFLAVGLLDLVLTARIYGAAILALAGPLYLILESAYRLYKAKARAEPAGSVVGYLLRLAVRPPD